jgi:dihydroorotate dehydrogenase
MIYRLGLKALHRLPPEAAHRASILALKLGFGPQSRLDTPTLRFEMAYDGGTLIFDNCVGLAAGYDKNADVPLAMLRAGFGFVECGTVTPLAQAGNPRPRLFRLTQDAAVINRMGFNNGGLEVFSRHLEAVNAHRPRGVIGLNIGANKEATDRMGDYVSGLKRLWGMGSYFTINISSPNTPGLRALQGKGALDELLGRVCETRAALRKVSGKNYPLFVKIAPDLNETEIEQSVVSAITHGLEGVIVSNTTLSRDGLTAPLANEMGGMSGAPLFEKSTWALRVAARAAERKIILIGAGGVGSGAQAYAKIRAGASLVQLYSALVFHGPKLVDAIRADLALRLLADGFSSVVEAVGADI